MIKLTEYIKSQNDSYDLINENFITDWLKKFLGSTTEKIGKVSRFAHDHFIAGYGIAYKNKSEDPDTLKDFQEIAQAKTPDDVYKKLVEKCKNATQGGIKKLKKDAPKSLNTCTAWIETAETLKAMAEEKKDEAGKTLAEKVHSKLKDHYGDQKYNKAVEASSKVAQQIKNVQKDEEKNDKSKENKAKKGEESGINKDGEPVAVSGKQQDESTIQSIKDNADFLSPLVKKAGIDGKTLKNAVNAFITKAFKSDPKGIGEFEWNKEMADYISGSSEDGNALNDRLTNGISSIFCGLLILGDEPLIKSVYNYIDPNGVNKSELLKMINTKTFNKE